MFYRQAETLINKPYCCISTINLLVMSKPATDWLYLLDGFGLVRDMKG